MHPSVLPLERTLAMNTRLFLNGIDGIDDTMALERPKEGTNHVAFLALHMLDARYFLLHAAGVELSFQRSSLVGSRNSCGLYSSHRQTAAARRAEVELLDTLPAHRQQD